MKLDVNLIGLCVSMLLSGWCLGIAHFYYGNSPQGVYMLLMMIFPGLTGLYFSTKVESVRMRWFLIILNYLIATHLTMMQFYGHLLR